MCKYVAAVFLPQGLEARLATARLCLISVTAPCQRAAVQGENRRQRAGHAQGPRLQDAGGKSELLAVIWHPRLANPRLANPRLANPRLANPRLANPGHTRAGEHPCALGPARRCQRAWSSKAERVCTVGTSTVSSRQQIRGLGWRSVDSLRSTSARHPCVSCQDQPEGKRSRRKRPQRDKVSSRPFPRSCCKAAASPW